VKIAALAGGVGGARLCHGLYQVSPERLSVVVNTGDDFRLHGLTLCPDFDTVLYTLAGWADPVQGWGVAGDTWNCWNQLQKLGGESWFRLGDQDLATHLYRSQRLAEGARLTQICQELSVRAGLSCALLPMADQPVPTRLRLPRGWVEFQDYFVRAQHQEAVLECRYEGANVVPPTPEVVAALSAADRIVLAPSNPFLSLRPILSLQGMADVWRACPARRVAVSPMIGSQAVKGPLAALLQSHGHPVNSLGIAQLLWEWADVLIIDEGDRELAAPIEALGLKVELAPTLMKDAPDRRRLAEVALRA
jgi:LPPG:FO 2-phospho-L-lactate transferase